MSGLADKVVSIGGREYSVSTVSRFGWWETAVFEGRPGLFSRKNQRYAAVNFSNDPTEGRVQHVQSCSLVAGVADEGWQMDRDGVHQVLDAQKEYLNAKEPGLRQVIAQGQRLSTPYLQLLLAAGVAGTRLAVFCDLISRMGPVAWTTVRQAATEANGWQDPQRFNLVTPTEPVRYGLLATCSARAGQSLAQSGVPIGDSEILVEASSHAAGAVLALENIPGEVFADLYAPFHGLLPATELEKGDVYQILLT